MTIKEKINKERGEYTKARRKKFLHLKRTGGLVNYYLQKRHKISVKLREEIKSPVSVFGLIKKFLNGEKYKYEKN